jgi:hypothetical protein
MSSPPQPDPQSDPANQAEHTQYYRRVLHELIDMGMDLARQIRAQAATPSVAPAADATIAFDRIARAIRRSVNLARHLDEPVPARAETRTARHRALARRCIIRDVEDAIQRQASEQEGETLRAELRERLDGADLDDDIDLRPVADIIADICRDFGIAALPGTNPWRRRTPADIAALCALAAAPPASWVAAKPRAADPPADGTSAVERVFHLVASPNTG